MESYNKQESRWEGRVDIGSWDRPELCWSMEADGGVVNDQTSWKRPQLRMWDEGARAEERPYLWTLDKPGRIEDEIWSTKQCVVEGVYMEQWPYSLPRCIMLISQEFMSKAKWRISSKKTNMNSLGRMSQPVFKLVFERRKLPVWVFLLLSLKASLLFAHPKAKSTS